MIVKDKPQMFRLLESDVFNHTRIWHTPFKLLTSGFEGPVALRALKPWTKFKPGMSTPSCIAYYKEIVENCPTTSLISKSSLLFHEWTVPESLVVNCDIGKTPEGYELLWSRNSNMSIDTHIAHGLAAKITAIELIGEDNWDKLQEIFDTYPDSYISFTIHNHRVGVLNQYMVIWEVRNY